MQESMLRTSLIEDLNRLACAAEQDRFADDPSRAHDAVVRLRWIDTSELPYFERKGWLNRDEIDLIERFIGFTRDRLSSIPKGSDALSFTRSDPGWHAVRERALELLVALNAFVDIGVPGWGHQFVSES